MTENQIAVPYPASLAELLKLADKEFEQEIRTISVVKLYELGKISSGTAAKALNVSRIEFLDMLRIYEVSIFNFRDKDKLKEDIANA